MFFIVCGMAQLVAVVPLHQIPEFVYIFQHDLFSMYTLALLSHLRRRFYTYNAYHTCSVVTGMRGAKVGVNPPRRSPSCMYYICCSFLPHRRNSQSGSHIRILMAGCSPLPTTCYGLSWGHTVFFRQKTRSYLTQSFISLFMFTGIYVSLGHITIISHLRPTLIIVLQVYPQWRARLLQGAVVSEPTIDRRTHTPSLTLLQVLIIYR